MTYLANSTFRAGLAPWRPLNFPQSVATAIGTDGTAFSGPNFLRFQTSAAGASVAADFPAKMPISGAVLGQFPAQQVTGSVFPASLCAHVYLRARPGTAPVSGTLAFWELGLPSNGVNNPNTRFTVPDQWTLVILAVDLVQLGSKIRLEIYLDSLNSALDVGSVCVA